MDPDEGLLGFMYHEWFWGLLEAGGRRETGLFMASTWRPRVPTTYLAILLTRQMYLAELYLSKLHLVDEYRYEADGKYPRLPSRIHWDILQSISRSTQRFRDIPE